MTFEAALSAILQNRLLIRLLKKRFPDTRPIHHEVNNLLMINSGYQYYCVAMKSLFYILTGSLFPKKITRSQIILEYFPLAAAPSLPEQQFLKIFLFVPEGILRPDVYGIMRGYGHICIE